jgi:hypothetical protein
VLDPSDTYSGYSSRRPGRPAPNLPFFDSKLLFLTKRFVFFLLQQLQFHMPSAKLIVLHGVQSGSFSSALA